MAIIINELLCYMLCKIDSVPIAVLVKLVSENFSEEEIDAAKDILCSHVDKSIKAGKRRGQNKTRMDLEDIAKMMVQCERSQLPTFVALDLNKLPPISVDGIDVSALMRKQQLMDMELCNMKDMMQDILKVTADTSRKVEEVAANRPALASGFQSASSDLLVRKSYADVVQDLALGAADGDWSVANHAKKNKVPAPRAPSTSGAVSASTSAPVTAAAGAVSSAGAATSAAPSGGVVSGAVTSDAAAVPAARSAATAPAARSVAAAPAAIPVAAAAATGRANPPPRKTVIGARKHGPIRAVAASRRYSMFMSRLPPDTGEEAVSSYVREQTGAEAVTAVKLPTRFSTYESYRIDIVNPPAELDLLDPLLWVEGLIVRRFFQRRGAAAGSTDVPSRRVE